MNAICTQRFDGRYVRSKMVAAPAIFCDDEDAHFRRDAIRGSGLLRDAILRAKGYTVPKKIAPPPTNVISLPAFVERKMRGRPKGTGRPPKVRTLDPRVIQIQELMADHFGISATTMRGKQRKSKFSRPRQTAMYMARQKVGLSYPDIAFQFGKSDHTTIIYAVEVVRERIAEGDQETIEALSAVYAELGE